MTTNKICPCCGSQNLKKGILRSTDALPIVFIDEENNRRLFNNKYNQISSFLCNDCGYVSMFSPINRKD